MRRWLGWILAVICLLLAAGFVGLVVVARERFPRGEDYPHAGPFSYGRPELGARGMWAVEGGVVPYRLWLQVRYAHESPVPWPGGHDVAERWGVRCERHTFSYQSYQRGGVWIYGNEREYFLMLRWWWVLGPLLAWPLGWAVAEWRRWRAGRKVRVGYCRRCGYDLRATPERCPECGEVVGNAKAER